MKRSIYAFLLAGFVLFLADCKLNRPGADVDFLIPEEFAVDLFERLDSAGGPSELGLIFRSFKTFPCKNTGLKTRVGWVKDSATIEVLETIKPLVCDAPSAPIETFIPLGQVKNGRFPLTVILGEVVVNHGFLTVSASEILIEMEAENGIKLNHTNLKRMPSEAIWGKVSYEKDDFASAAQAFLTALDSMTAATDYNAGYFGQFTLGGSGASTVHLERPKNLLLSRDFVRQSSRAAEDFDWLLQKFRSDPTAPLDIQFWTKKGAR